MIEVAAELSAVEDFPLPFLTPIIRTELGTGSPQKGAAKCEPVPVLWIGYGCHGAIQLRKRYAERFVVSECAIL